MLVPALHPTPTILFLLAVLVSARYAGTLPAILTTFLSVVAVELMFVAGGLDAAVVGRVFTFGIVAAAGIRWAAHVRMLEESLATRMRTIEALQATETRFQRFMHHLPGLAWVKDLQGRYVYVNHPTAPPFNQSTAVLYGRTDHEIFPAELAERFVENDRQALASETGTLVVDTLEHDDGVLHHSIVSKFPIPGADGTPILIGGMAIDITEQKRAEELLQKIIDTIPVMISMYEPDTHVVRLNREFTRVVGWTTEESSGLSLMEQCYPDREYRERVREFMQSCRPGWMDFRMTTRDGREIETSWANIRVSDNTQVGIGIDITDRKRTEEALREADRRKDEFLATLSHELRNPLAPICTGLDVLRQLSGSGPEVERVLEIVERQVQQLVRLVDDLLDIARITTGKIELRKQRIPLNLVVNDAIESSRPLLDAAGHHLTVSLPGETIVLDADRTRLSQVLMNLLNNAAKFTEPGGDIALQAQRENGSVVLRVRDSGAGIPADKLSQIFEMFAQVDRSFDRARGGLGIGLSLVRALVELHGGKVEAKSEGPGRGSEFIIQLPLPADASLERERRGFGNLDGGPLHPAGKRILVVDDNEDAADSLSLLLGAMGYDARPAYGGRSALEAAPEFLPSLVLLDIGMPGMNGFEVARSLRERPELANTVLVALTGWGQNEDRQRTREAGFHHHLVKPVDAAMLRELLRSL
jgi:PAS domain S-box-containing protein